MLKSRIITLWGVVAQWWVGALRPEGRRFEFQSSRRIDTIGQYYCPCAAKSVSVHVWTNFKKGDIKAQLYCIIVLYCYQTHIAI